MKKKMEAVAKKAVKGHEARMHGAKKMAKGGKTPPMMNPMAKPKRGK
jgi:hypothetical protein